MKTHSPLTWFLGLSLALAAAACSDSEGNGAQGAGASGGAGGSTSGSGGSGGSGGVQGLENEANHKALAYCAAPACTVGLLRLPDAGAAGYIQDMTCALEGMRDRTAGAYDVSLRSENGLGAHARDHRLLVTASGEVETAVVITDTDDPGEVDYKELLPTQRCSLKPAVFFEDCLVALAAGTEESPSPAAFDCIYPAVDAPLAWLEGCVDLAPVCE